MFAERYHQIRDIVIGDIFEFADYHTREDHALAEIIQNQKAFIPTNDGKNVGRKAAGDVGINREVVMKMLKKQPHSTAKSLAEAMNLSPRQVERVLAELKKEGRSSERDQTNPDGGK